MSMYYEANGGDKDAQDMLEMSKMEMLKSGASKELIDDEEKLGKKVRLNVFRGDDANRKIGVFEKHTKGLGRRLLERSGWKEGEPIGNPSRSGLVEALDATGGKVPADKSGIGYYGPKLDREKMVEMQKKYHCCLVPM